MKKIVKGFTLVELIVVIVILAGIGIVANVILKKAKKNETQPIQNNAGIQQTTDAQNITYKAVTEFEYSTDGTNWSSKIMEFPIGIRYYMNVVMQVSQSEKTEKEKIVKAEIAVPMTKIESCRLTEHSGEVTPRDDSINHMLCYDFNIVSDVSPENFTAIFKCIPKETGEANIRVTYDDKVSQNWDKIVTVSYVENKS